MDTKRPTILVVDDSVTNIEMLSSIVGIDYEVLFATTGEEAVEIARNQSPDLILLDIIMPGIDGYETCRRIKKDEATSDIPIIFITAMNQEDDESKGLDAGGIDYITKPICPPIVKARIRNHLELKRYHDLFKTTSSLDGLTGIANRRRLDQRLETEWTQAKLVQTHLSFLIIDVDYFKEYNDHYGHLSGDECLKKIGRALFEISQQPGYLCARFGGDEFALILSNTDDKQALQIANQCVQAIRELNIGHRYSIISSQVTLSIGVATMIPSESLQIQDLVNGADQALYIAKKKGRNRIVSSEIPHSMVSTVG
jgi:diguanylate cyclase (GGDEF)-like protein